MKFLAILGLISVLGGTILQPKEAFSPQKEEYFLVIEEKAEEATEEPITVELKTSAGNLTMPLEDYLVGVVLTEMPASFDVEAMKAQAVAARTFARRTMESEKHADCDLCSDPLCCQAWRSDDELRLAFGTKYESYFEKGKTSVQETEGQVLVYGDALIEALYYSCSGGMSEPAVAVWGNEVPYLQAVESPGEEQCSKFSSEVRVPFGDFRQTLRQENKDVKFSVIPQDWVGDVTYSAGGGVAKMDLGGVGFTGTQLRQIFSLASTKFDLSVQNGEMVFAVYGYGHRVGMSQYGADAMAAAGKGYEEILTHYYTGVSIKKLSRT